MPTAAVAAADGGTVEVEVSRAAEDSELVLLYGVGRCSGLHGNSVNLVKASACRLFYQLVSLLLPLTPFHP